MNDQPLVLKRVDLPVPDGARPPVLPRVAAGAS